MWQDHCQASLCDTLWTYKGLWLKITTKTTMSSHHHSWQFSGSYYMLCTHLSPLEADG